MMIGAMIGDIAGSVYEFNNTRNYDFPLLARGCNYTDDSIMTLAVADWAMSDQELSMAGLERALVGFAMRYPCPMGGYGGGFRTWLFHPDQLRSYDGQPSTGRHPYRSWGNGSAMRVSSIGWLFPTLEETVCAAGRSAVITHDHPEGIKGAQAVAAAIFLARTGSSKPEICQYISMVYGYDLSRSWSWLHEHYTWDSSCQGTVPEAIICFLESTDYEDAIRRAVSIGGDSDTLACITGGIAEAYYRRIPSWMLMKAAMLLPDDLKEVYRRFCERVGIGCPACFAPSAHVRKVVRPREFTPARISHLNPGEIFVFGSNLQGYHGGGAARTAYEQFGAEWGIGVGRTGQCYAIPTMHGGVEAIRPYVEDFIRYAGEHPELKFWVTRIGCGIAGFADEEIAPLFRKCQTLANVVLPRSFWGI